MINLFLTGPIFIGVKLIGDHFVPSGEESTRVDTTDSVVRQNINFDQPSEKEMKFLYFFRLKPSGQRKDTKIPSKLYLLIDLKKKILLKKFGQNGFL